MLVHRTVIVGFDYLILFLCIIGLLFHVLGNYLLVKVYKRCTKTAQRLYLMNFSIVETLKILLDIILISIAISYSSNPLPVTIKIQHNIAIISETMMTLLYYTAVIYMTADRLLAITLELRYHVPKWLAVSKYLIIATWILAVVLGGGACLAHNIEQFYYAPYHLYVYFATDTLFILFAIFTYSVIFRRFKNSLSLKTIVRRNKNTKRNNFALKPSITDAFKSSHFHVAVIIMSSFLCFMVIPDFVNVAMVINHLDSSKFLATYRREHQILTHILLCFNTCADIGDACIYIFLQKDVRKDLRKIMNQIKHYFKLTKGKDEKEWSPVVRRDILENLRELRETSL